MNSIDQQTRSLPAAADRKRTVPLRTLARLVACLGFGTAVLAGGTAHAAQGDNIALHKPVTMSGTTADPTLVGANCTDGNRNGNHPTDGICWTGATQTGANREWIEVDLGQDYIIDRVRLSNRTDGTNGDFARWLAVTTRPSSLTGVTSDPLSTLNSGLNPNAPFVNKIAYGAGTSTAGGIYGTGQGDPWTTLDMKVGTHVARYVRIYTMKPNTVLNLAEIEVFEGPPPSRSIVNQSFEQPGINAGGNAQIAETLVPGWSTTEPVAVPNPGFGTAFLTGGNIEMWNTGFGGVTADAGNQFVELNAFNNGTLSPAPLCVYPGETFNWRVSHRARGAAGVTDVARLRINGQDIATFHDGVTQGGTHTCTPEAGFTCTAQAGSPTATGWGRWQGSWTNAQAQPKAMTFEFAAISSSGGSGFGNFIDNVSITGLTAAVEFSAGTATGPESIATANLPKLLVNGPVATAQTIQLDIVGGSAVRGTDFTTNPAAGPIVVTIPAGTYDGTAATAISLAPYLQIVTDSAVEGAETIALRLTNASAGLSIAGASGCRTGVADSTYTITDEAVPTIGKRFAPDTIPYGGSTTLTFTIDNSGAGAIDRPIAFTDNLAAGLQIADPADASTTCGGSVTAAAGDSRVVFAGGSVPAGGFCTVSVDVTNRPGFSGLCYNPNFANENQNLVGLQNLIAQIEQYTCVSVTPPDCPDSAVTNGFGNISGLSPNLSNGISGQCIAVMPTIRLVKVSEGGTGSFGFALDNTNAPNPVTVATIAPGAPGTSAGVFDVLDLAQPVTIAESTLPAGWTLSNITCQLRDGTPIGGFDAAGGILTIAPGDLAYGQQITCTATNLSPANVVVAKTLTGESGSRSGQAEAGEQLTYTITLTNTGGSDATGYGVTDTLDPNVTFVSASNGGSAAGGAVTWSGLTVPANGSLTLTVVVQVVDPLPPGVAQIGNVAYETGTTPPTCPPAGGQCVVIPTAPSVTLAKALTGESGSRSGEAEAGEQLTYTITLTNSGGSDAVNYGVTDTLDPNVTFVSASNGGTAAGGAVTWSGLTVPANGTLSLTVVVHVVDPIPAGVTQIGNVAYETGTTPPTCPPAGGQCVVVPTAPKLALAKSAGAPTPTGAPNQYAITYVVTVRNDGGSVGEYDLADTLSFNGATVSAVSTPVYAGSAGQVQDGVLGGIGAPNGGSIVGNERIGALGTESWTYTVTYTIDDADLAADCAAPDGGLRNQAALGGAASGVPAAGTCTGAPSVGIVKTASAPVPTGNPNQFTLTYVVDVANTGTLPGRYDLADALSFNGATVDAITAPAYGSSSGDAQDGTPGAFAAPDGGTIVTGEAISAGGAESWTYLVTYTVTDPATAQDCASPSGGLRNRARLGGSLAGESTTCTGAAAVVIGKSASGPTPTGNPNEYRLTYRVGVQNNGTLPGNYDLADTFAFAGATVVSVSAVQHGGGDPLATTLGTLGATGGSVVSGESIAAGADENYTYSVVFTIDDLAAIGTCANGGGLKNHAALGGSSAGQVETCSDVPDVAVSKAASGPTPTGTPNQYAIVYTVTVDNGGGAAGSYDLADAFAFAGATIDAVGAVTHAGPDPLATTLGTLDASGGSIVTAETIAAGGSESYTYTVTFTLTDADLADDCTNPAGGLRNTAALGGSAVGDARTCTGTPLLAIVKTLTGESGSTAGVAEPGEQLTYTITLNNGGSSDAVDQSITDRLDPNVTFVSADHGGALVGGDVQWTGLTVPAGGSLALTVAVRVADPIPDGVSSIGNVAYDPSIGPPDCEATPRPSNCTVTPTPSVVTIIKALAAEGGSLPGVAEPGEQLTYTITLSNAGGSDATGYGVTDALDPNTRFVSADHGGVHAGGVVTWSGLTVPANGSLVLTVVVQVADPLPAGVTQVANVAYQTGTTPPSCPPAGGQCVVTPTEGAVRIVKSVADASGDGLAEPGEQLTYTIALTNTGGSAVTNYAVTDPLDANTRFVSADNGGVHAAGVVNWSGLTVPANGTLNLTVVVQVNDPLPAGVTLIGNVAYETGTTPPDCNDKGRPPGCVDIEVPPQTGVPRLSITKTASSAVLQPGGTVVYTITVRNVGTADASDVVVSDPIPVGIDAYAWTCAATGLTCPNASGSGAIAEPIASFPVGASVVYTVTATLSADPPATVNNTATVTPGGIATCADGSAPPCPATAIGTVVQPHAPLPVPTVHLWAQLLIALSLFGLAWRRRRS